MPMINVKTESFFEAINDGDHLKMRQCLAKGVDPNAVVDRMRLSPLHLAVTNNDLEAINLLLDAGANPWITDSEGQTPLDFINSDAPEQIAITLLLNAYQRKRSQHHHSLRGLFCGL